MYNHQSTLTAKPAPMFREIDIVSKSIQTLDIRKGNFYEAFRTSDKTPLIVYPMRVKSDIARPYIECALWERAAASVFKSSVIFLSADKRGLQLDCHALNKRITLFVQWKEVGVTKPDKSHFDLYLGFLKQGMLKYHFDRIVSQPNKVRKAIFKAIDSISSGLFSRYQIGDDLWIETSTYGGWDILKGTKLQARNVCLEQITTKIFNL
jgi:hypothetical protein